MEGPDHNHGDLLPPAAADATRRSSSKASRDTSSTDTTAGRPLDSDATAVHDASSPATAGSLTGGRCRARR